jgi:regulator of protease activity HflC (stomatin/prohibitin superfamily)
MNDEFSALLDVSSKNKEKIAVSFNGFKMLLFHIPLMILAKILIITSISSAQYSALILGIPLTLFTLYMNKGYFTLEVNTAVTITFYGKYIGTIKLPGFHWINPLMEINTVSLKSNNLNGETIKVNDKNGSPIQIAAVIVWKVSDTYKAFFEVANYSNFVKIQSEAAVRNLAAFYPYDKSNENEISLRCGHEQVSSHLKRELQDRLEKAGVEIEDAKISNLSYAPEIASSMLKRQQAEAVIAAREKIVHGAVSIVGQAIHSLKDNNIVDLSQEEKAKLVTNLLVVLCSESQVHPVINTEH